MTRLKSMEFKKTGGAPAGEAPEGETFYHLPVLLNETVSLLVTSKEGVYIDGTLGGGGHSAALLALLAPAGKVVGIDRDPEAIARATARLSTEEGRFSAVRGNYSAIAEILAGLGIEKVDGILLDLGVSSRQLDAGERGFSFMRDGPLDMRMGPDAPLTAAQIVNDYPEERLVRVFREYGEEPRAARAARSIAAQRGKAPFSTTGELAAAIEKALGRNSEKHPATRIFQALRIEVNRELEGLEKFLASFPKVLKPGGRVAVISYHSLEDRLVKNAFRALEPHCVCPPRSPICNCGEPGILRVLTRKAVKPSDEETKANSRARSARLRAAELIAPDSEMKRWKSRH